MTPTLLWFPEGTVFVHLVCPTPKCDMLLSSIHSEPLTPPPHTQITLRGLQDHQPLHGHSFQGQDMDGCDHLVWPYV